LKVHAASPIADIPTGRKGYRVQSYYGSRTKAALYLSCCFAFVAIGVWTIGQPSIKAFVGGWLTIGLFGAFSPLWMAAIFRPNRLTITDEGFSVHQTLVRTRTYCWSDIAAIFVHRRAAAELVVWTLKDRPRTLATIKATMGQPNTYDGYLPAGWQAPAIEIAAAMEHALRVNHPIAKVG
jgi:hypothetical protein